MPPRAPRPALVLLCVLLCTAVAGCTAGPAAVVTTTTRTHTATATRTPPRVVRFRPPAAHSVKPLPPGARTPKGEVDKRCPYLRTGLDQDDDTGVNLADIVGSRVYRTTVLTRLRPVGCRFYFYAPPYEASADIKPRRFATAAQAHDALVLTARTGHEAIGAPRFVHGADGISYRTRFFAQDGDRDWAFAFAKGRLLVVVDTFRTDTSRNALYVAKAIAGKF